MTRTDVHSPTNAVMEDYEFVAVGDHDWPEGTERIVAKLAREGWSFDDVHEGRQCSHCGAHLRYYAILKHTPSHTLIHVGETCLDNRFELATDAFRRARDRAAEDRKAQRFVKAREEWLNSDPQRREAFDFALTQEHDEWCIRFVSIVKGTAYASDKFVAAILRTKQRQVTVSPGNTPKSPQEAAQSATEVPEGEQQITGIVLKLDEKTYGEGETVTTRQVMTVKDNRGFKLWGTVPAAIDPLGLGERVQFTADVERSGQDAYFGFYKFPRQASKG